MDLREHTFQWKDIGPSLEAAKTLSGLEYMTAIMEGRLPAAPIAAPFGMALTKVSEGHVVFEATPAEYHYNPLGTVHGGMAATLLDSSLACCIHTMLPAGVGYTTLEIKVNYIRAMTAKTGPVRCIGTVIHVGRTTATSEAKLLDSTGKLYAHGSTTCLIFRP
ncbi:MAG: PaaI family thioesterase [Chloroflexota bacterium]